MRLRCRMIGLAVLTLVGTVMTAAPAPAVADTVEVFGTGTIGAGKSRTFFVTVTAYPDAVIQAGLFPTGDPRQGVPCELAVTRGRQHQLPGGVRRFRFTVANVGPIACSARAMVGAVRAFRSWGTGTIAAGAARSWIFNNANPTSSVYTAGVLPGGDGCEFEVERTWYQRHPGGERKFGLSVRNVGQTACSGDVMLARTSALYKRPISMKPGQERMAWYQFPDDLPEDAIIAGLGPETLADGTCRMEIVGRQYNHFRFYSSVETGREVLVRVKNTGSVECSTDVLFTAFR